MELLLVLGLPVIIIVSLLRLFKVKWPLALLIILGFSVISTYIVNFTYCEILKTKCESDALNAVGHLIHWLIVSVIASVLDFTLFKFVAKKVENKAS